jgi:flagella basal body P-ring formation protein FlgA
MIRALALLLLGGTALAAAGAAESAADVDNPVVGAARVHLLEHLRQLRPDIERFELTLIGHMPAFIPVGAPAEATHGSVLSPRTCVWIKTGRAGSPATERRPSGQRGNPQRGPTRESPAGAGSVPVWFAVKAYRPVLVTQRNRGARDSVDAGDFAVEERDVAPLSGVPWAVDADVTRMRSRHAIATGRIVMKEDLEEMPQVLRGQEVTVEVRHGAVEIETSAIAVREARLGEPVTLQNPSSHMNYAARVVGQARAVVIE